MTYKSILKKLLLEKGAKKAKDLEIYYFLVPENIIEHDPSGFKYTISKVVIEPEVEIHCFRHDLNGEDENIVITANEFKKFYKVA